MIVIDRNLLLDENNTNLDESNSESESESLWWLCKHTKGERVDQQGLVPRNYLCLYPTWKYRKIHDFVSIELPTEMASTAAQQRRRLLQQTQHEDDNYSLFQWNNVRETVAAATAAAQEITQNDVSETQSTPATSNSLTSTNSQQLSTYA